VKNKWRCDRPGDCQVRMVASHGGSAPDPPTDCMTGGGGTVLLGRISEDWQRGHPAHPWAAPAAGG
jgi:hypothetical protein